MPANYFNKIEIKLTNPVEIDLSIDSIELLAEAIDSTLVRLKLFDEKKNKNTFVVPSLEAEFKLEMGFVLEQLGQFKIIG